jgi:uncharacterized protein (TIGR04141 family)
MADEAAEIAQITFFLAKEDTTFATIFDAGKNILNRADALQHNFKVDDAKCRFVYFETIASRANPPWLDFINENLSEDDAINFSTRTRSANGILLVTIDTRIFAATFGRSAGSYLEKTVLEPDFGIKAAMNMCGNEEVRQTRSQSHAITPTQIDRQVGKPSDTFVFGLSEAEDLRYISAHMKDDSRVTLQGRDSLTVKVIGKNKLTWEALVSHCKTFLEAYGRKDYEALFPNYKNFRQASEEEVAILDEALINLLRNRDIQHIQLGIPEFVSEEDYSFSYSNHSVRENSIYAFLNADQLKDQLSLDDLTIDKLKGRHIYAYSHVEDKILPYRKWQLYKCISFEKEIEGRYFVLSDGRWLEVDNSFYNQIIKFIAEKFHEEPHEPIYTDIDISDDEEKKNLELIFNKEVCNRRPSTILFDRAKLRIGEGPKNKEFCDILDLTDDGKMRIIHCKPYKDSSSTSYLISQAQLYCEAFVRDKTFLGEIRDHIKNSNHPDKNKYLEYIKDDLAEINGHDYVVCLWLLYNRLEPKPNKSDIPLMAQYELKLMYDRLRYALKFQDVILRFVPVRKKNYRTDKTPAA